jgi:hypothetical protein
LFVGSFDRLLRCETPAGEVLADAASLQLDPKFLLYKLTDCRAAPQVKVHLELLRALVDDHALDGVFLHLTERTTIASGTPAPSWSDGAPTARLKQIDSSSNRRVAQASHRDDLHDPDALPVQPHDLLAPFVKLLESLISRTFFFHDSLSQKIGKSSDFIRPYL